MGSYRQFLAAISLSTLATFSSAASAATATGYLDAHATSDDVRVSIDTAGQATIEHRIAFRVGAGQFKGFDIVGVEKDAVLEPVVAVTTQDAGESAPVVGGAGSATPLANGMGAHVAVREGSDTTLRITLDDAKGVKRGTYAFALRYRVDMVAGRAISRDGALFRVVWTAPIAHEGLDGARVVFELPSAPTEPRSAAQKDGAPADDGTLATLRRAIDHDELELVRPHVARGEAATWAVRVDPKAFPEIHDARLRPPPPVLQAAPARGVDAALLAGLGLLGALFAFVALRKARNVATACEAAQTTPRPLVALPLAARVACAGLALAAGVFIQLGGKPTGGAIFLSAAMALVTFRTPTAKIRARGPGSWLAFRPDEAFEPAAAPGAWLDAGTRRGRAAMAIVAAVVVAITCAAAHFGARAPLLIALDAIVLLPLFLTGGQAQLPPTASTAAPCLRPYWARLSRDASLRVTAWARVPSGESVADELRVLTVPRAPLAGLFGLEIGLAWALTPAGYAPTPEVLVRVHDGSAAAARLTQIVNDARSVPGRRPDERVFMLKPRSPSVRATLALVTEIARELSDRRVVVAGTSAASREAGRAPERRARRAAPAPRIAHGSEVFVAGTP